MSYRYFAWRAGGYWRGHKLLSPRQIHALVHHLDHRYEVFASIEDYDEGGGMLSCPIYADFDHKEASLETTQKEVQTLVYRMTDELGVIPRIYFSGNKGFHVVLPYRVEHPHCHHVVREIIKNFARDLKTLDQNIYHPRRMFRLPGSPGSKPGHFKVQITREELFTRDMKAIEQLSLTRQHRAISECDLAKIDETAISSLIEAATQRIAFLDEPAKAHEGLKPFLTPCIEHFLTIGVPEGSRNKAVFILSKFFKASEVDVNTARDIMLRHNHLKTIEETEPTGISTVLKSVYKSPRETRMGCRKGSDGELMREYCKRTCPFHEDFPALSFGDPNDPQRVR